MDLPGNDGHAEDKENVTCAHKDTVYFALKSGTAKGCIDCKRIVSPPNRILTAEEGVELMIDFIEMEKDEKS